MRQLWADLRTVLGGRRSPAILAGDASLDGPALVAATERLANALARRPETTLGLLAPTSIQWCMADLACLAAGKCLVPLPCFFSPGQWRHIVSTAGLSAVLTSPPEPLVALFGPCPTVTMGNGLWLLELPVDAVPVTGAKLTFTSGTTGSPKGVLLGEPAIRTVVHSLIGAAGYGPADTHLCLMPLTTLLENLAGLYAPLLAGATVRLPDFDELTPAGETLYRELADSQATTAIFTPRTLADLVDFLERHPGSALPAARFLALGGALPPAGLLTRAQRLGLPVYEGYGLSEACSVVAVNTPAEYRPGTVGKPLPHVEVRIADDGEILVRGATFLGYLGAAEGPDAQGWWPTGDLGQLAADGYLTVFGRRDNRLIIATGRNIDPAWVTQVLRGQPEIGAVSQIGECRDGLIATLTPATDDADIQAAVDRVNRDLPAYARIVRWQRLTASNQEIPIHGLS